MIDLNCTDLKVGDRVTILCEPPLWDWFNNGKLKYPYTFIINKICDIGCGGTHLAISIDDTDGYCWSINRRTYHLFEKNDVLNDRKNRIDNLNIEE